jgi:hypothetical protein
LRWFEACSCKPAPRGPPSSFVQLRTLYIKSALVAHLQVSWKISWLVCIIFSRNEMPLF